MSEQDHGNCCRERGSDLNADSTLGNSREHLIPVEDFGNAVGHRHPLQPSKRKERSIDYVVVQLAESGLNVATKIYTFDSRILGQNLRLTAKRCGADHGTRRQCLDR